MMTANPQIALSTQKHIEALSYISAYLGDINEDTNEAATQNVSPEGLLSVAIGAVTALASLIGETPDQTLLMLAESATAWSESTQQEE